VAQLDELVGQQPHGPAPPTGRRLTAGQGDQVSFLFAVQLTWSPTAQGLTRQNGRESLIDKRLAHTIDRGKTHLERLADLVVGPGGPLGANIGFQENPGAGHFSGRNFASGHQVFEIVAFLRGQGNNKLLVHD
jgi:hypothetical protein